MHSVTRVSQAFVEEGEFSLQNLECSKDDLFWSQSSSALNGEDEAMVILANEDCFGRQLHFLRVACALLAERALVSVFNLDCLLQGVDAEYFARALRDEG